VAKNTTDKDLKSLRKELRALRKYKESQEFKKTVRNKGNRMLFDLWAGPGVTDAFKNWIAFRPIRDGLVPIEETADLAVSIIKRIIRVGVITVMLALIPSAILIWQNLIMHAQNESLIEQIEEQRKTVATQQVTEYIDQILSGDDIKYSNALSFFTSSENYRTEALTRLSFLIASGHPNTRCVALKGLLALHEYSNDYSGDITLADLLEKGQSNRPLATLEDFECSNLDFSGVDFGQVNILNVKFSSVDFYYSDLSQVIIGKSSVVDSQFALANFCDKDTGRCLEVHFSDLSESSFYDAVKLPERNQKVEFLDVDLSRVIMGEIFADMVLHRDKRQVGYEPYSCLSQLAAGRCYDYLKADLEKLDDHPYAMCEIYSNTPIIVSNDLFESNVCDK